MVRVIQRLVRVLTGTSFTIRLRTISLDRRLVGLGLGDFRWLARKVRQAQRGLMVRWGQQGTRGILVRLAQRGLTVPMAPMVPLDHSDQQAVQVRQDQQDRQGTQVDPQVRQVRQVQMVPMVLTARLGLLE